MATSQKGAVALPALLWSQVADPLADADSSHADPAALWPAGLQWLPQDLDAPPSLIWLASVPPSALGSAVTLCGLLHFGQAARQAISGRLLARVAAVTEDLDGLGLAAAEAAFDALAVEPQWPLERLLESPQEVRAVRSDQSALPQSVRCRAWSRLADAEAAIAPGTCASALLDGAGASLLGAASAAFGEGWRRRLAIRLPARLLGSVLEPPAAPSALARDRLDWLRATLQALELRTHPAEGLPA